MKTKKNIALLVVSFGTSHADTCKKTIEVIEEEIHQKYANYPIYRAWTSSMLRRIVEKRDGLHIFSVTEALEQICRDGIEHVIVQPTHVLNGIENTSMENDIASMREKFSRITIGAPLLSTPEDINDITDFMIHNWQLGPDETLVYVGHGSEHDSNAVYAAINKHLRIKGCSNIILGTMKATPTIKDVLQTIKKTQTQKIILAPFMIVAGSHAVNELAGNEEDSWKSTLEKEGYTVECMLTGLGEYPYIRQIFLKHLEDSLEKLV